MELLQNAREAMLGMLEMREIREDDELRGPASQRKKAGLSKQKVLALMKRGRFLWH